MKEILDLIGNAKSVAILPHISADGDAIASCKAMEALVKRMGKEAVIYAEEEIEPRLKFMEDGIVIFDGTAPVHDTCIVLDCGDVERTGERHVFMDNAEVVINIDHHKTNTYFGDVNMVMPDASATGEILAVLFKQAGTELNHDIALYLYTAICSDTGCFAYSNVLPQTFRIAAELIEFDINHAEIARQLFDCVDLETELLKCELTNNIHSYYDGKLRIVAIDKALEEKYRLQPNQIQGMVDIPRRIRGTEIAASIKISGDLIRVSLRSNGDADVAEIALKFGGGGHVKAAGCSIDAKDIVEAEAMLVEACKEVFA